MSDQERRRAGRGRAGICALALAAAWPGSAAWAMSAPDPGDIQPAPPGMDVLLLYGQHLRGDRVYADGKRAFDGLDFRADVLVARYVHFFALAGKTTTFEVISMGNRQRDAFDRDGLSGMGNLVVGTSWWPKADESRGRYLTFAAYLSLPTSPRAGEGLITGEDRYTLELQGGYMTKLAERWTAEFMGQAEFYTHDDSSRVHRAPMYRAVAHLSYNPTPETRFALSARQSFGARESLHGERLLGSKNDTNLTLTWAQQLNDKVQVQLQYTRDLSVREGPQIDGVQGRLALAF